MPVVAEKGSFGTHKENAQSCSFFKLQLLSASKNEVVVVSMAGADRIAVVQASLPRLASEREALEEYLADHLICEALLR